MSKKIIAISALILVIGGGLFYFYPITQSREDKDYNKAYLLIQNGNPNQALTIIQNYQEEFSDLKGKDRWLNLFIQAVSKDPDLAKNLARIYQKYPNFFLKVNEEDALQTASGLLGIKDFESFEILKNGWKEKTQNPDLWTLLTIDRVLSSGDKTLAKTMLEKETFQGHAEILRLMRLSFLEERTNPKLSWDYLTEAVQKDPKNSDLRSLRASLLERVGKTSLALDEFQAALALNPEAPKLWDQLAQFYLRQGQWTPALLTWEKALKLPKSEQIWINLLFWSKVVRPLQFDVNPNTLNEHKLKPFILYLYNLPEGVFWDTEAFQKVEFGAQILASVQEAFWLRLLQALKEKREKDAFDLIAFSPFRKESIRPDLEYATLALIQYRSTGDFTLPDVVRNDFIQNISPSILTQVQTHQFLKKLSPAFDGKLDPKLEALIKSDFAFSTLYAAGGWYESALNLNFPALLHTDIPSWVAFTLTQAVRVVQGNQKALEYAEKQPSNQDIDFLKGEILSQLNRSDEAEKLLLPLAQETTPIGIKSAWDLVNLYLSQNKPDQALKVLDQNSALKTSVLGKELSARAYATQGESNKALEIFSSISNESYEAKSFLANYYVQNGDWTKAEPLILELIKLFPNAPQIQKLYQQLENHKKSNS